MNAIGKNKKILTERTEINSDLFYKYYLHIPINVIK